METKIRVLVVDDHRVVREGLGYIFAEEGNIDVVGQADNGEQAVLLAQTLRPDVILMDLVMPKMGGIEAIQAILRDLPQMRILVLSSFGDDERVFSAIRAGALGYVMKDSSGMAVIEAIRQVYRGETYLQPSIGHKIIQQIAAPPLVSAAAEVLTNREREVLGLIAQGLSNKDVAHQLVISERTVYGHVYNIMAKLHVSNRAQAVTYALKTKLVRLNGE
jgi:NarL family two-component system response regulator LiaR